MHWFCGSPWHATVTRVVCVKLGTQTGFGWAAEAIAGIAMKAKDAIINDAAIPRMSFLRLRIMSTNLSPIRGSIT
jgi:hypothetical protein